MVSEWVVFCRNLKWLKRQYALSDGQLRRILKVGNKSLERIWREEIPTRMSASAVIRAAVYFRYRPYELFTPLYENVEDEIGLSAGL